MNDNFMKELDIILANSEEEKKQAEIDMQEAERLKVEATSRAEKAEAARIAIEEARIKALAAQEAISAAKSKSDEAGFTSYTTDVNNNDTKSNQNGITATQFIAGLIAMGLVGGAVGYAISDNKKTNDKENTSLEDDAQDVNYEYNYDGNVVTLADEDYKEMTTEDFERLTSLAIKNFSDKGITIDGSDIIKFVMIQNIDKLSQDNQELVREIVGNQNPDEVRQDAYKYVGAAVMYNYNLYYSTGSTEGFIKASDTIFDEETKAKVVEIERRIEEEIAKEEDNEKLNELIHDLCIDLLDPTSELSYLEAGIKFGLQIALEPVRGLYGMDLYGNNLLDDTNAEIIKYIVPYSGDEQEYEDNAILTGAIKDINDILNDCVNTQAINNSDVRRNKARRLVKHGYDYESNTYTIIG